MDTVEMLRFLPDLSAFAALSLPTVAFVSDEMANIVRVSLLSPLVLAFVLGILAKLVKSELEFPEQVLKAISIYLLFSIGIKGGTELAGTSWTEVYKPALAALAVAVAIPTWSYILLRKAGRFDVSNAAGIAAHYGSVSSVTFIASLSFAKAMNTPAEGFMPVMASLMEWGIIAALFIGRWRIRKEEGVEGVSIGEIMIDTLRGRSVVLLLGGLTMGYIIGETGFKPIKPFFEDLFRGVLVLYLLEMGMVAARQLRDFFKVGPFMVAFGIIMPIVHGVLGATLGTLAGLSLGGSFVFGAICASASYIDAPATVRATFPKANPSIYLTSSLAITFPFNLIVGLPIYYEYTKWLHSVMR